MASYFSAHLWIGNYYVIGVGVVVYMVDEFWVLNLSIAYNL